MANGPMGGFMPTPPAPAQPPQVKLDTTATSRGNFNTFLKNMNGATSLNPPSMAPSVGAATPTLAPTMSDIDVFNPPVQNFFFGGSAMSGGGFSDAEIGSQIDDFNTGDSYDQGGEFSDTNVLDTFTGGDSGDDNDDPREDTLGVFQNRDLASQLQELDRRPLQFSGGIMSQIPSFLTTGLNFAEQKAKDFILSDLASGNFDPIYDSQGRITGSRDRNTGAVRSGMDFNAPLDLGDNNDDPLLRKLPTIKEQEEKIKDKPPNQIGDVVIRDPEPPKPTVVASPFAPATSKIEPIGFDSGELNKLIELLTGVPAKPVVAAKEGGLIKAVDDFLATGT